LKVLYLSYIINLTYLYSILIALHFVFNGCVICLVYLFSILIFQQVVLALHSLVLDDYFAGLRAFVCLSVTAVCAVFVI